MRAGPPSSAPQPSRPIYGDRPSAWWLFWQRQKIRLRHGLFFLFLLILAGGAGWFVVHILPKNTQHALSTRLAAADPFRIHHIVIKGRRLTDEITVLSQLEVTEGQSLFSFSPERARQRINTLPFVDHSTVERHLPDTIVVTLTEHLPVAVWQTQGHFILINRKGEPISNQTVSRQDHDVFDKMPLVVGRGANTAAASIVDLLARYPEIRNRSIALIRIGERRWNILMRNGTTLLLPEGAEDAAFNRLTQYQQQFQLLDRPVPSIDIRLPDRMVIHLPHTVNPDIPGTAHPATVQNTPAQPQLPLPPSQRATSLQPVRSRPQTTSPPPALPPPLPPPSPVPSAP